MATIVRFPVNVRRRRRNGGDGASLTGGREGVHDAEIVVFPGVRYEYLDDGERADENALEARERG